MRKVSLAFQVFVVCSLALAVAPAVQRAEDDVLRPASAPGATGEPSSEQDLSWFSFDLRPPFIGELYEGEDTSDVLYPGNAVFTAGDPPDLPPGLSVPLMEGGRFARGWFLVHYERPIEQDDKLLLDLLTGPITRDDGSALARWYVPNDTLVAWVDDLAEYALLEALDPVDWIGRYEPGYKLDPRIGTVELTSPERFGRNFYRLDVELMPGHPARGVARAIGALGATVLETVELRGETVYDVRFLVVDALPDQVVSIAGVEGVRMVQERGDGLAMHDLSGGGKLQNRTLAADDGSASPIVTASTFPLWVTHNLQGQGQLIGVVDTSMDWNNTGTSGCTFGYPNPSISNYGFADPVLSSVLLPSVGSGGVSLKVPRADLLGGATLLGVASSEHGVAASGAALADFYGNDATRWWEHDVDDWESWAPTNYSGLLGPGIAHEAQLYFTPVMDSNNGFRWESFGEFEANMDTTLGNMSAAGVCSTNHSVGLAESSNTYTQVSVVHDTNGYDHPDMLQCMAAGNSGTSSNALTSQAVVKNALGVGASDDVLQPENRASFSSIGPAFDGRTKPDVMAPGTDEFPRTGGVQSLLILPDTNGSGSGSCAYQWTSGTSFASPTMAGAAALVHQYFQEGRYGGATPIADASAALMKAALVNAGHRLTGSNLGSGQYPNSYQGWGEPNLSSVLDHGSGARRLVAHDVPSSQGFTSASSSNDVYSIQVNGSGERLRITLAWTDEPGSAGTGKKLVNDLNLLVQSPGGSTYRGNVFNGSAGESTTGGSANTLDNVENVILSSPATGAWTVTVDPGSGNYAAGQGYALVVTGEVSEGGGTPPPAAGFSGSPTSGDYPLNVSFANQSTGSVTSWGWTFGDGGTSSAQNPSHTYTAAGSYTVSLTATGPGGADVETKTGYVTVTEPPPPAPTAGFSASPTSGDAPLSVDFTDQSTGSVTSWSWTFGDGGTSTGQDPSHTYTSAGTYTVSLTATGPGGSDQVTKVDLVSVGTPPVAPTAEFSGTPTSGEAPVQVSFTDLSSGAVDTWSWGFGDGGISAEQNPTHTYTNPGSYTVNLTVSGPGGADVETKSAYVTISAPPTGGNRWYLSFTSTTNVPGVGNVRDEDVVTYDPETGQWELYFDGSDVGVGGSDVDALHVLADGDLVLSFTAPISVPGLVGGPSGTAVDDSDLVIFDFAQSGSSTSGTFEFSFDGSDVGLTKNGEDIDGVYEFPDGGLGISTRGSAGVPGLSGVRDEDVMFFAATAYGSATSGSWSAYFDGSDVGFSSSSSEDLGGVTFEDGVDLLFSTVGSWSASGGAGADEDVGRFSGSFGSSTSGAASLELDLSALGISTGEDVDGLYWGP